MGYRNMINCLSTLIVCILMFSAGRAEWQECVPRQYNYSSVVCVCNSKYCDTVDPVTQEQITGGSVKHYVSTLAGKRLQPMVMKFSQAQGNLTSTVTFKVNRSATYQNIVGFGGALTDSAAINLYQLSEGAQEHFLRSYFGSNGIGFTMLRLPIGGTDFSTRYYSLDDVTGDVTLQNFSLTVEDTKYKIPIVKRIRSLSPTPVKLFSTAWSAPDWMKDIGQDIGYSTLKTKYYQVWADYFSKFLDAYVEEGITFWAITPQNEPTHGTIFHNKFNNMGWTAETQLDWLVNNLLPTLQKRHFGINLMLFDDQRIFLKDWMDVQLGNETLRKHVAGIAVHSYTDMVAPASVMDTIKNQYPDKFLFYSETSITQLATGIIVKLGSWENGQQYISSMINVTSHSVSGWTDWNLLLDLNGGPSWASTAVDSAVIANFTADEFYKQPIFYAQAHFSKFVPPGSVRIGLETEGVTNVESVAFLTPDNNIVIIFNNPNESEVDVVISDPSKGSVAVKIAGDSFNTLLYK